MPRATNLVASRRRRRKMLSLAKGYWGRRGNVRTVALHSVDKALQYQYRDRRARKRNFRRLWIARINAAARMNGTTYSRLVAALRTAGVPLNRKVLADLAVHDAAAFTSVVEQATA
ncbi:MAG TPA: 50S ribosomal protein L20 [Rubricoccaceae bacterium]|nr:50S ribosomal protein L20 [Rubricoccaceae bacterium]